MRFRAAAVRAVFSAVVTTLCASAAFAQNTTPATPPAMTGLAADLYYSQGDTNIHAMPTYQLAQRLAASLPPTGGPFDLTYRGGPIMPSVTAYTIFWQPSRMQNGAPTIPFPLNYKVRQNLLLTLYAGHAIGANNTQYYQIVGRTVTFIPDQGGGLGGTFDDPHPFPPAGCSDPATPGNCLSDAQLQAEIKRVVGLKGWRTGLQHMVFIYTPQGMGSCMGSNSCAYTAYCAYHGSTTSGGNTIIYGNEPYGSASGCWDGGPAPSGDIPTDSASDTTSHELTEAITDPLVARNTLSWYNNAGGEIGDLCNFNFGVSGWDGGKANQMWSGNFFRIQQEYSNLRSACVQAGP